MKVCQLIICWHGLRWMVTSWLHSLNTKKKESSSQDSKSHSFSLMIHSFFYLIDTLLMFAIQLLVNVLQNGWIIELKSAMRSDRKRLISLSWTLISLQFTMHPQPLVVSTSHLIFSPKSLRFFNNFIHLPAEFQLFLLNNFIDDFFSWYST